MRFIRTYENFKDNSPNQATIEKTLRSVVARFLEELKQGSTKISDDFGDGTHLSGMFNGTKDERLQSIISSVSKCCSDLLKNLQVRLSDYMSQSDCDYLTDYLNLPRVDWNNFGDDTYEYTDVS